MSRKEPQKTPDVPDRDVNQRTGVEDRATPDSFGDRDEAALESNPKDNPAIVPAVRGSRGRKPRAETPLPREKPSSEGD